MNHRVLEFDELNDEVSVVKLFRMSGLNLGREHVRFQIDVSRRRTGPIVHIRVVFGFDLKRMLHNFKLLRHWMNDEHVLRRMIVLFHARDANYII